MATYQLIAPLPQLELTPGMVVKLEAISPTTGLAITGVKAIALAITAVPGSISSNTGGDLTSGPYMFVPGPGA